MPMNLITIGASGAAAARAGLELAAQNVANASNPDYVRRTLATGELVGTAIIDFDVSSSFSGVRIGGVQRPDSDLVQRRARDSGSDLARAEAELAGLRAAETALEEAQVFEGLVAFESALTLLESDPTDPALRTGAIETARQLTQTFQFADLALKSTRGSLETDVVSRVSDVNNSAQELARINVELVSSREGTPGRAALMDARDAALRDLAKEVGIVAEFDEFGAAEVRMDGSPALVLVDGATTFDFNAQVNADGSVDLTVGGTAFGLNTGAMAGRIGALAGVVDLQTQLDTIAASTISRANTAQASGAALDGSNGQPLFSGTDAETIALAFTNGAGLALAPAGSPAGSRDTANLGILIAAFGADDGPIADIDRSLVALSSRIAGLDTTREGLQIISDSARADLLNATGVDLDQEAADLIRLQQAFEANSRVIQVATDIFDTVLALR